MLTPRQLEHVPDQLLELWAQVEADILAAMARRIAAQQDFIPAAQWQFERMQAMNNTYDEITARLAQAMKTTVPVLEQTMGEAVSTALKEDDQRYREAGKQPKPLGASPLLQQVVLTGLANTQGLFDNLTRTTANTATRQFEQALDRAWLQVSSGAFSHQEAVRLAIKDLARQGVACIAYPSGHVDHLDVAVRRAVLTGINQTCAKLQLVRASEMGCDLVEVTAHAGARSGVGVADHAGWQGKVYALNGFKD